MVTFFIERQKVDNLQSRPVAELVQLISSFDSNVYLEAGNRKVNGKSIMGMMSLGLLKGDEINIICDGSDEEEAIKKIKEFFEK